MQSLARILFSSQVRARFTYVMDRVSDDREPVVTTRAKIMASLDDRASMDDTTYLQSGPRPSTPRLLPRSRNPANPKPVAME